jgi:hypothetical protein
MPVLADPTTTLRASILGIGHRLFEEATTTGLAFGAARDLLYLLHSPKGHAELIQPLASHQDALCDRALEAMDEFIAGSESEDVELRQFTNGIRDVKRVLEAVAATGRIGTTIRRDLADYVWACLDGDATQILKDRHVLKSEIEAAVQRLGKADGFALKDCLDAIGRSHEEKGVERREILRESLRSLEGLVRSSAFAGEAVAFLHLGWLLWSVEENQEDALLAFRSCPADVTSPFSVQLCALCASELLGEQAEHPESLESAILALRSEARADWMVRSAAAAQRADHEPTALQYLEIAIFQRPMSAIEALAEDELACIGLPLLDVIKRSQAQAREEASRHNLAWERVAKVVRTAQSSVDFEMHVPARLMDGCNKAGQDIASASLFLATALSEDAQSAAREAYSTARDTVARKIAERGKELAEARAELEQAWASREIALKIAFEEQDRSVNEARSRLGASNLTADNGKGCGMAASAGCGVMMLYAIAATIFAGRGFKLDPSSPASLAALAIAALPALMVFLSQAAQSTKRAGIEAELNACIKAARERFQEAALHADEAYRSAVAKQRDLVAALESQLRKAEDGQRILAAI